MVRYCCYCFALISIAILFSWNIYFPFTFCFSTHSGKVIAHDLHWMLHLQVHCYSCCEIVIVTAVIIAALLAVVVVIMDSAWNSHCYCYYYYYWLSHCFTSECDGISCSLLIPSHIAVAIAIAKHATEDITMLRSNDSMNCCLMCLYFLKHFHSYWCSQMSLCIY